MAKKTATTDRPSTQPVAKIGYRCACGFLTIAMSLRAAMDAMVDHAEYRTAVPLEGENPVSPCGGFVTIVP